MTLPEKITLTLSGEIIYRKGKYAILLIDDYDDLNIVVDTSKNNDTIGFSYHQNYMEELIDDLLLNDPV